MDELLSLYCEIFIRFDDGVLFLSVTKRTEPQLEYREQFNPKYIDGKWQVSEFDINSRLDAIADAMKRKLEELAN